MDFLKCAMNENVWYCFVCECLLFTKIEHKKSLKRNLITSLWGIFKTALTKEEAGKRSSGLTCEFHKVVKFQSKETVMRSISSFPLIRNIDGDLQKLFSDYLSEDIYTSNTDIRMFISIPGSRVIYVLLGWCLSSIIRLRVYSCMPVLVYKRFLIIMFSFSWRPNSDQELHSDVSGSIGF